MACKYLLVSVLLIFVGGKQAVAQSTACKTIDIGVTAESGKGTSPEGSIKIDLKQFSKDQIVINLVKPRGEYVFDTKVLEFTALKKGEYVVIATGRKESDNYCPTYTKLLIE